MLGGIGLCALAAFCLSKWASEADWINFSSGTTGNGFHQCGFGRGSLRLAPPSCYRILFPFILYPERTGAPYAVPDASQWRWISYQALRFLVIWLALLLLTSVLGIVGTLIAAALFGLSIHFDYWSNTIELLAVALVLAAPGLHLHWLYLLGAGLVLGTGRETIVFLGILGTPHALALAGGALIAQVAVRHFVRTEEHWYGTLEYANPMWRTNWRSLTGRNGPDALWRVAIYVAILSSAFLASPFLSIAVGVTTFVIARIDEPRTITMLIPFAAATLCR